MSAESDKIRAALVDQLASFEDRLDSKIDDVHMLADIRDAIGRLIGAGSNEAQIRRVLQERYENGDLRKETFQLVKSMLDGFGTENSAARSQAALAVANDPAAMADPLPAPASGGDDAMSSTVVLSPDTAVSRADTADDAVQVGSVLRDRFMLQERITGGSMGVVYKALDRRLAEAGENSWVALKVLSPQLAGNGHALRALQQEAAKGRCLTHPNIVRFIDLDRDEDLYFIVMEWLDGRTLADILDDPDTPRMDTKRAFEIVRQIGNALDYAHRCGIVHADVKPGNIMIMPDGTAKLFDFGVARVRQKTLEAQPDFDPAVLGLLTPAYSSMQVLTGETPTPADDVFSLACLLYRLIAGYRVFGPRNAAEAAEQGMKPQRLENISDAQWRVIKKALSYARVTRFASMSDFIDAIDVPANEPVTISVPAREDFDIDGESSGSMRLIVGLAVLAALLVAAEWQFGLVERIRSELEDRDRGATTFEIPDTSDRSSPGPAGDNDPATGRDEADAATAVTPGESAEMLTGPPEGAAVAQPGAETAAAVTKALASVADAVEATDAPAIGTPPILTAPLVDFSKLAPADLELPLVMDGSAVRSAGVTLRENRGAVTIDLLRSNTDFPLTLRLEEISYSGNRSPWASGQYVFSDNGFIEFPVGQERARLKLEMTADPVREADQQSTLRIREADSTISEFARINVTLEDDDQRNFEATLPANTVGFATSQVSVREQDPAVQIDILRFNPDDTPLVIGYTIRDITATQGEDYFAPGSYSIEFGPGQRSARLLIPLVQDSDYENNEAFSVELATAESVAGTDVFSRTAVMIRDDDT